MLAGAWALAGACALVAAVLWSDRPALAAVAVLGLLAALGERQSVVLDRRAHETVSLGGSFIILAGIIGGPLGGALVGLLAMAGDTAPPWPRRITFTGVQIALGAAAGTAASWVGPTDGDAARIVLAVLAGTLAGVLVNVLSVTSIDVALRAPSSTYRFRGPLLLIASSLVWLPVPVAVAFGYDAIGVPLLLLAGTPMVVVALVRRLRDERERLGATLLSERAGSAISLVRSLDARDRYTAKHSAGVAVYAGDLAARLGLEAEAVRRLRVCGLLHDIGKIAVPVEVLHKRGALDAAELAIIREHPLVGESILRDAPGAASILPAVRHHHERPDGAGYPDGLGAGDIPVEAAIVAVADAYSAMTHDRPHRAAFPPEEAIAELRRGAGEQWDGAIVDALCDLLEEGSEDYRRGRGPDFDFETISAGLRGSERLPARRPARAQATAL